jgi:hypothetical protein
MLFGNYARYVHELHTTNHEYDETALRCPCDHRIVRISISRRFGWNTFLNIRVVEDVSKSELVRWWALEAQESPFFGTPQVNTT